MISYAKNMGYKCTKNRNLNWIKISVWQASHVSLCEVDVFLILWREHNGRFRLGRLQARLVSLLLKASFFSFTCPTVIYPILLNLN